MQKFVLFTAAAMLVTGLAAAQPSDIVDIFVVKVKPEKRMDFDAVGKKIADANQKYKGDRWLAFSVEYGDQNTVMFSSVRKNLAAIDASSEAFMNAMKEGYGPGAMKLFQDMNNCAVSTRGEVRRRRMDLSWNVPSDPAEMNKLVGRSKWVRFRSVRTRPGRNMDYEEGIKVLKAAVEKEPNGRPTFVSQSVVGQPQGTYYFTNFAEKLGDFDPRENSRTLREMMGSDAFDRYQKSLADDTIMSEWTIARIVPELSTPTEEMVSANPEFWHPKASATSKPAAKPKPAAPAKSGL